MRVKETRAKRHLLSLIFIILLSFTVGCGDKESVPIIPINADVADQNSQGPQNPQDPQRPVTPNPDQETGPPKISELRWYPHSWEDNWSQAIVNYLDETSLIDLHVNQVDLKRLSCSGYADASREERKHFWVVLMASISSQEAAFNPRTRYYERQLGEWSEGLFQLSVSNRKPKGGCSLIDETSILRPLPNIYCALDIMENQVRGSRRYQRPTGRLFPARPYYWSVLTRMPAQGRVIEFFKRHLDDLPFCKGK